MHLTHPSCWQIVLGLKARVLSLFVVFSLYLRCQVVTGVWICAEAGMTEEGGWNFEYVPGAGDDEESWAKGLTPQLLWSHKQALLCSM